MKEKGNIGKVRSTWEEERKNYFKDKGIGLEEIESSRKEEACFSKIIEVDKELQRKERKNKIKGGGKFKV